MGADQVLSHWLAENAGLQDAYVAAKLGGGNSNVTLLLESRQGRHILRRPPGNSISPLASRGVKREFDVLRALDGAVPAPRALAFCDDPAVVGAPFAVFSFLAGVSIMDSLPEGYIADPAAIERIGEALIDGLASLHQVDPCLPGLPGSGGAKGFLQRQIERWVGIRRSDQVRDLPLLETVARELVARLPAHTSSAVLHGDFHLDNTLFVTETPELSGIIDWELATVGDPMCDLGLVLAFWGPRLVEPAGFDFVQFVSRSQDAGSSERLADRWSRATGRDVVDLPYYRGFALWRLAAMVEGAYALHRRGKNDNAYARRLEQDVPRLLDEAAANLGLSPGG